MKRACGVVAALALLLFAAGCSSSVTGEAFDLAEFSIDGPTVLDATDGSLRVTNSGEFAHTLVVTDSSGEVVAATSLIQPGESTELTADLDAGRYSFTCRIVAQDGDGNLIDHFEEGMNTMVSVSGPPGSSAAG